MVVTATSAGQTCGCRSTIVPFVPREARSNRPRKQALEKHTRKPAHTHAADFGSY